MASDVYVPALLVSSGLILIRLPRSSGDAAEA
jgi:hypothetical protein